MPDGSDDEQELNGETGGALRKKLEAALRENAELLATVRAGKAKDILSEKGYTLITVEDLRDVPLDELATKAETLNKERSDLGQRALRASLEARGLTGDDLDSTVAAAFGTTAEGSQQKAVIDRLRQVGSATGTPPQKVTPDVEPGYDRIRSALGAKK